MPKMPIQRSDQPFQRVPQASTTTGLSQHYLREGIRNGTIPHIRSGNTPLVNVPALLRQLGAVEG